MRRRIRRRCPAGGAAVRPRRSPKPRPRPTTPRRSSRASATSCRTSRSARSRSRATSQGLATERERLNSRLVETADLIKKSEGQLTTIETRLGELDEQQRILKGSLNQRNNQIAKLLSALQRMGRNPPPVLITQREDALQMVRSAMLLSAAFPELGSQAKALTARLTELVRVMTEIRTQRDQLRTEMTRLSDARTRLAGLMEEKKVTLDQRQSELKRMRTAAADISRNVNDLNDLISQARPGGEGQHRPRRLRRAAQNGSGGKHYAEFICAHRAQLAGRAAGNFQGAGERRTAVVPPSGAKGQ